MTKTKNDTPRFSIIGAKYSSHFAESEAGENTGTSPRTPPELTF
ncbi:hypothetical protein [Pontixanthobacter aquaemixtae]|nr:hypothetical protein [Pontixanthobacter aquaemixtae]